MNTINLKYASINTKLKGMYTRKINTKEEFYNLIRQTDLKSAILMLKDNFETLQDLNENSDRIEIEQMLDRTTIQDIKKIYRLLNKKEKRFFMIFISEFELDCLKSVLKNITNNVDMDKKLEKIEVWTKSIFIELDGITKIDNIEDFLLKISKSIYYDKINKYLEENSHKISLFEIETILDKTYFEILYKEASKINNDIRKLIRYKDRFIKLIMDI